MFCLHTWMNREVEKLHASNCMWLMELWLVFFLLPATHPSFHYLATILDSLFQHSSPTSPLNRTRDSSAESYAICHVLTTQETYSHFHCILLHLKCLYQKHSNQRSGTQVLASVVLLEKVTWWSFGFLCQSVSNLLTSPLFGPSKSVVHSFMFSDFF